jgi:hypothetical protein
MDKRFERITQIKKRLFVPTKNYLPVGDSKFSYIRYRILRPLIKVRYSLFRGKGNTTPWLSESSILFFKEYLDKSMIGCEFGSGASTAFFASRLKFFVSIEHNEEWYSMVKNRLQENGLLENVDYRLIEKQAPNPELTSESFFPDISGMDTYQFRSDYIHYFSALNDFPDEHFDFIIVDGRARPECVFSTIRKLKSNGFMILDNSERERYSIVFNHLNKWEKLNTTNGLTDTTFWIKP